MKWRRTPDRPVQQAGTQRDPHHSKPDIAFLGAGHDLERAGDLQGLKLDVAAHVSFREVPTVRGAGVIRWPVPAATVAGERVATDCIGSRFSFKIRVDLQVP